ncbi:MAG: hypothetical protein H6621_13205 [Halobacteriovoraceae bacterium]|nr:hypothetical protein [Halobacteriovoraceae bacterium]
MRIEANFVFWDLQMRRALKAQDDSVETESGAESSRNEEEIDPEAIKEAFHPEASSASPSASSISFSDLF